MVRFGFIFPFALVLASASDLSLGAPLQRIGRGALLAPAEMPDSIAGKPLAHFDPRTGSPSNFSAQRLHASGELDPTWTPDSVTATRFAGGTLLRTAGDGTGGKFVVWTDGRTGVAGVGLARLGPDGLPSGEWPVGGVLAASATGARQQPDVASDGAGGALLVWSDFRDGDGDIYALRIAADGTTSPGWPAEGLAVCSAAGLQANPRAVAVAGGGAMLVWEDRRTGRLKVYAQRLGADPAPAPGWPAGGVSLSAAGEGGALPGLYADSLGGVVAVWQRVTGEETRDLVAAVVSDELAPAVQPPPTLVLSSGASAYGEVASSPGSEGSTTLAWSEWRAGGASLRAQRVTVAATIDPLWPAGGVVVREGEVGRSAPALLAASDTSLAIAWSGHSTEAESDVFVQMLGPTGTPLAGWPEGGTAACVARGDQYAPALARDGEGGVIVRWTDGRPIGTDGSVATSAISRTAVELVSAIATPGRAWIVWRLSQRSTGTITALRRIGEGAWEGIAAPALDDSARVIVDDRTVPDGVHAGYRLVLRLPRTELHLEPVALDIPRAPVVLALHRVRAIGRERALLISFALPRGDSPRLDLIDIQGRRMLEHRIDGLEPGEQQYRWMLPSRVPSGIYFLRLMQGREVRNARVVYIQ